MTVRDSEVHDEQLREVITFTGGNRTMARSRHVLTSTDLARLAGVSQSTVSRVLTNSPRVSPETRARVLQVLEAMNYTPNAVARAMKTGRTNTIGVFMSRMTSPFHAMLLDLIARKLSRCGMRMILWDVEHEPAESTTQVIQQGFVDGFVFTSAVYGSRLHEAALLSGTPTVLLHRPIEGLACDQVVGDNWQGAWDLGSYLVDARHTKIGLITGSSAGGTSGERQGGFRAALAQAGVKLPRRYIVEETLDHSDGHAAARKLLTMNDPPTAIFATSDLLAFGVLDAARSLDVRVPDDLWVTGFDNTDMAAWEGFDLTTVDQPVHQIVEIGVDLLLRRINDHSVEPVVQRLACELVIRGSTAHTKPRRRQEPVEGAAGPGTVGEHRKTS